MDYDYIEQGNCFELMKQIPDDSIDLTVTSPPYDDLRTYTGYEFDFENIAKELYRITKIGGVCVWIVADATVKGSETLTSFKQALFFKDIGFNIHDTMIWDKGVLTFPCKSRYYNCFEYMFILSKGKPKAFNLIEDRKNIYGGTMIHGKDRLSDGTLKPQSGNGKRKIKDIGKRFNVWRIPPVQSSKERTKHPAQFPIQLAKDHIVSWSNENDVVFDPFLGSGTTVIAAMETKRHYIGFEISEEYFNIACNRLHEAECNER